MWLRLVKGHHRSAPLACKTVLFYSAGVGYTWLPGLFALLVDVEPHEVMQVLQGDSRRRPRPALGPRGLAVLAIFGRSTAGRDIVVIVRHLAGMDWQIVGARPMTAAEAAEFDKEAEQ